MKTFQEYIMENHPESLEEGFWKNLAIGGTLVAGALGAGGMMGAGAGKADHQKQSVSADNFDNASDVNAIDKTELLQVAAQKVGIPHGQKLTGTLEAGIVTSVNGKKVPLTPQQISQVNSIRSIKSRMGGGGGVEVRKSRTDF